MDKDVVAVLTLGAGEDGRGAILADGSGPPSLGALSEGALERVAAGLETRLRPSPGILTAAALVRLSQGEEEGALLLEEAALQGPGMTDIVHHLWRLRGLSEGGASPLTLLLDLRSPPLSSLPWELLGARPPASSPLGGGRIARLQAAPLGRMAPLEGPLEVCLWSPDGEDPTCARVETALQQLLAPHPAVRFQRQGGTLQEVLASASPGFRRLIHVVAHGKRAWGRVELSLGEGASVGPEDAAGSLGGAHSSLLAVLLDVCSGSAGDLSTHHTVAGRLVSSGVPFCLGPRSTWGTQASQVFSASFYRVLLAGGSLLAAVDEGRRGLRALGVGHPDSRFWNPIAAVSDRRVVSMTLNDSVPDAFLVWPRPSPDAIALLRRASPWAEASGFWGVEHLCAALARFDALPGPLALAQPVLGQIPLRLAPLTRASPSPPWTVPPRQTPRMVLLGGALSEGFTVGDLCREVIRLPWVRDQFPDRTLAQALLTAPHGDSTLAFSYFSAEVALPPPPTEGVDLEVLGGPEDGRVLNLYRPGQALGRRDPKEGAGGEPCLYQDSPLTDPTVSRRHLLYRGGGILEALGSSRRLRGEEAPQPVRGEFPVQPGDRLLLGRGTVLEVRGVGR